MAAMTDKRLGMQITNTRLDLYRSLYWANQGLLNAVHSLHQAETPVGSVSSKLLNQNLRRVQTMIQETRMAMNKILGEWIERRE